MLFPSYYYAYDDDDEDSINSNNDNSMHISREEITNLKAGIISIGNKSNHIDNPSHPIVFI
jgi:hypothetical protein